MSINYLEFERPIADLDEKIAELERLSATTELDLSKELSKLRDRSKQQIKNIFSNLGAWEVTQLARHPLRPYTLDFLPLIFTDFQEIHGDRMYADDPAIVAGLAKLDGINVAVIGHQKGRDTKERTYRNFGMPRPEGYRKAQRIMKLAERFKLPLVTMIDTPGAYPGLGAEERGQSEAIARSLEVMVGLKTPIVSVVIGEGGSGGALAIGVCDNLKMMQYSTYSVISPEGCASILWKSASKAADAAVAMGVTSEQLYKLGLVDEIIEEPLGGAHRDYIGAAKAISKSVKATLNTLSELSTEELLEARYTRLMQFGQFELDK